MANVKSLIANRGLPFVVRSPDLDLKVSIETGVKYQNDKAIDNKTHCSFFVDETCSIHIYTVSCGTHLN